MTETKTNADELRDWLDEQDWVTDAEAEEDLVAVKVPEGESMGFFQRDAILERGWVVLGVFPGESCATVVYEQIPSFETHDEETTVRAD